MDPCHRVRAGMGERTACATHNELWPCQVTALSLTRPWSELVAHGLKDVENRTWSTPFRGVLVLHAAKSWDDDAVSLVKLLGAEPFLAATRADLSQSAPTGYVGWCRVVDVHRDGDLACFGDVPRETSERCSPWAFEGQCHWKVIDAAPFAEVVPGGGRLGLFAPPIDVIGRVRDAMWEAGCRE